MTATSSHQSRSYVERESPLKGPFGSLADTPASLCQLCTPLKDQNCSALPFSSFAA